MRFNVAKFKILKLLLFRPAERDFGRRFGASRQQPTPNRQTVEFGGGVVWAEGVGRPRSLKRPGFERPDVDFALLFHSAPAEGAREGSLRDNTAQVQERMAEPVLGKYSHI